MTLGLHLSAIIAGLVLLTWSADRFINGAVGCSERLHLPPMLTGLVLVAVGTSAPEIVVSVFASITGAPALAVGNALGSNIANIGLVLGLTTLIAPIPLKPSVLYRELPILLLVSGSAWLLFIDYRLTPLDGVLLLLLLAGVLGFLVLRHRAGATDPFELADDGHSLTTRQAVFHFLSGLLILIASARLLVWGASELAISLGIDELIVGLTVVAIGTSLPELAASLSAALKGQQDMALGNIVGSNIFNLLAVLAVPALLSPMPLTNAMVWRDYGTMAGLTVLLAIFAYGMQRKGKLARFEGGILLTIYAGYTLWLVTHAR
ncbi:calcium/sodium antiporter [Marinobacter caseinilyticus]|uniref:calcium/sodium antiporter n=1 Tax=Marinobacter caseinilyticus TaxID=2692195 RepID=UPI0014097A80|nr:calcium/sodium antiporter [Marinobacter caseinilyticus]